MKNGHSKFGAPDHAEYANLLREALSFAEDYARNIDGMRVSPDRHSLEQLEMFDVPLPDSPTDASEMLGMLNRTGSPNTVASTGGRYFGFVIGGAYPPTVAARILSDAWDQNTPLQVTSPVVSKLESVCEKWLVDLLGFPEGTGCGFVSGTSVSLICGLATARNSLLLKQGWDTNGKGLLGAPDMRVVVSEQAHSTVKRALSIIGLGIDHAEVVPTDEQGRMIGSEIPRLDSSTLIIAQAGNVNSGAFDPLQQICDLANEADAWVHVDGAFGLWAQASPNRKSLCLGIERADSWSADAHKTLNVPYDCGLLFCRERNSLMSTLQSSGSYIQWSELRDGMNYTPEMSRRSRVVELWALLKVLGRSGIAELVDHLCDQASYFAKRLKQEGFRILNDVVFNQVLVACESAESTKRTLAAIQESGECWCGGATWKEEPVIRISVCSWATSKEDIERSVAAFVTARQTVN